MCLVVAYQRLKTIENSKTVNRKSGRSHLWQYKALTENIFGILGRWSLMGGGRPQEVVTGGGPTVLTEKVLIFS